MCSAQAVVPSEVAEAVGGFSSLTPSGTSVLLQGELTKTPEGTKQVGPLAMSGIPHMSTLLRGAGGLAASAMRVFPVYEQN